MIVLTHWQRQEDGGKHNEGQPKIRLVWQLMLLVQENCFKTLAASKKFVIFSPVGPALGAHQQQKLEAQSAQDFLGGSVLRRV